MSTLILTGISISILQGLVAEMASNIGLIKVYNDLNRNYPETQYNFAHPIHIQSRLLVSFFYFDSLLSRTRVSCSNTSSVACHRMETLRIRLNRAPARISCIRVFSTELLAQHGTERHRENLAETWGICQEWQLLWSTPNVPYGCTKVYRSRKSFNRFAAQMLTVDDKDTISSRSLARRSICSTVGLFHSCSISNTRPAQTSPTTC